MGKIFLRFSSTISPALVSVTFVLTFCQFSVEIRLFDEYVGHLYLWGPHKQMHNLHSITFNMVEFNNFHTFVHHVEWCQMMEQNLLFSLACMRFGTFETSLRRVFQPFASLWLNNICHLFVEKLSSKLSILKKCKGKLDNLIFETFF